MKYIKLMTGSSVSVNLYAVFGDKQGLFLLLEWFVYCKKLTSEIWIDTSTWN